jgi:hypothetical protein
MSPRLRYNGLGCVAWPVVGLGLVVCALAFSPWLVPLLVAWAFYVQWLSERILCPECGLPVGWRPYRFLDYEWW